MTEHMKHLLQHDDQVYLTDGGLETTLIFHEGFELPYFAAFDLVNSEAGRDALINYYETYANLAVNSRTGFILESPTWRANRDWGDKMGYHREQLANANQDAIKLLKEIRKDFERPASPFIISGCIGPRGDGYVIADVMSCDEARDYHREQIESFAHSGVDMVSAMTMTYPEEAIGIVLAARQFKLPVIISFTTETDGRLPNGMTLQQAIESVDAATDRGPAYYMINCAHPEHFQQALEQKAAWVLRIQGIRANASRLSHAQLDEAEALDSGDPDELGNLYKTLRQQFPQFRILGGCCGTDHRHVEQICHHCVH